jgi:hypothetical protein
VLARNDAVETTLGGQRSSQTATTARVGEVLLSGALEECTAAALHMRATLVCPEHANSGHNLVNTTFSDGVLEYLLQTRYPGNFPFWQLKKGKAKESHITF